MKSINTIGIIGLGWLGETLGLSLKSMGYSVWGTVRSTEKAENLQKQSGLDCVQWTADSGVSSLKESLSQTDLLIITLPPSSFAEGQYHSTVAELVASIPDDTKLIYTSSTGVYQDIDKWQNESSEALKDNAVAQVDRFIQEKLGDRSVVLRLGGLIGEDRNPVKYLVRKDVNFNPDEPVHLIHKNDIIAVVKKLLNDNAFGNVYNVINPERPTRKTYYSAMAAQLGYDQPRFTNEHASKGKQIDTNKLEKELQFNTFTPLLPKD